jgi:hypothetical protein
MEGEGTKMQLRDIILNSEMRCVVFAHVDFAYLSIIESAAFCQSLEPFFEERRKR